MKKIILLILITLPVWVKGQSNTVEVWMRAFIPNPANAGGGSGYIISLPNGGSYIKLHNISNSLPNYCFLTDDRGFSNDPSMSSRVETRFSITLWPDGKTAVNPKQERSAVHVTTEIDCCTGATIKQQKATLDRDAQGQPALADGIVQVIGQVTATNVLTPAGEKAPAIDYGYDLQWKPQTSTLIASLTYGSFPAFEMYARQPLGEWVSVVNASPSGTPWSLGADGFGINTTTKTFSTKIKGIAGIWHSALPEQRFTIEFMASNVKLTEKNDKGAILTREVPIIDLGDGTFRIERANDAETLTFLGFQPNLRAEILARGPLPSFIILSRKDGELRADWNGLIAIKGSDAHLKELIQPGTRPAKPYILTKQP